MITTSISPTRQKDFISQLPDRLLSNLLPENQKEVHKALCEYVLLLFALLSAIEALENGELGKFDALVAENQCQVRAIMVLLNYQECLFSFHELKMHVEACFEKAMQLLDAPLRGYLELGDLLKKEALEITLSGREFVFLELFLLTIVKKETGDLNRPDLTYLPYLKKLIAEKWTHLIGNKFTDKLTKLCRKEVSRLSKPFFQELALTNGDQISASMLERVVYIEERECIPAYWITETMLKTLLHKGISVVQHVYQKNKQNKTVKEFCIYYESDSKNLTFVRKTPLLSEVSKAVLVVKGVAIRDEKLGAREISCAEILQISLVDYFRMHGGSHRQFPNSALDYIVEDTPDENYHFHKKLAIKKRCTKDDPQLFHIFHIYADRLGNIKPIKYEINTYLEATYGDFYRTVECNKLKEIIDALHLNLTVDTIDKKLRIGAVQSDDVDVLERYLIRYPLLHRIPSVYEVDRDSSFIELSMSWLRHDPLMLAALHPNPARFLVDHRVHWDYYHFRDVMEFFVENPESLKEPEVVDIFFECLLQKFPALYTANCEDGLNLLITGLVKALDFQETQERALNILIDAASSYDEEPYGFKSKQLRQAYFSMIRRSKARSALRPHYQSLRSTFQEMFDTENVPHLKIELLNILEGMDHLADQLDNGDVIKGLAATWKFEKGNTDSERIIQKFLELIRSDATSKNLRIVSIRYLFHYYFSFKEEIDVYCYKEAFSIFHPVHSKIRKEISLFLKDLAGCENVDVDIRQEASSLLNTIVKHLKKIQANNHPTPEVRAELSILIQSIELH